MSLRTLDALKEDVRGETIAAVAGIRARLAASATPASGSGKVLTTAMTQLAKAVEQTATALTRVRWRQGGWKAVEDGLWGDYRRARRRFRAAHTTGDEKSFHAWRIATKSLMFQLCFLRPAEPRRLKRCLAELDALQGLLGDEHDLTVLASKLKRDQRRWGEPGAVELSLNAVAARQQRLRKQALKMGRTLFARRPKEFIEQRHREWKAWRKR
jgi:CHAD domain-containing protein